MHSTSVQTRRRYLDVDGERHDEHGDHEVGDGQRHDEVVGDGLQRTLRPDAEADQSVAERRRQRKHDQQQRPGVQFHCNRRQRRRGVRRWSRIDEVSVAS